VGGDSHRVLQNMQGNLSHLTQRIPMVKVDDLPEVNPDASIGGRCTSCLGTTLSATHKCHCMLS
jgi:hypothetical protein